jgi:hypothetical protein
MSTTRLAVVAAVLVSAGCTAKAPERRIGRAALEDKVRGGWAGQMIGVAYGGPTEFHSNGKILDGDIAWSPDMIASTIDQDDLYVEMTFAEVMDTIGLDATSRQFGEMFRGSKYNLWHANAGARRNLNRGIEAPMSGHPKYNIHANDIDFQIESDFIGLMCPGLPRAANTYADRVGRVMNYGDGLYGGMFVSGMYAAAFFESDPRVVVEAGLRSIPADSGYARVIRDVLAWHDQHPDDWKTTWTLLEDKWDRDDPCPDGALAPFNIDARLNGGYIVLGLLYGGGDLARTLEVATRSGQDSDCNPSSAAGVLGVILGYEKLPDAYRSGIPAIADTRFAFTRYSFHEIVASTLARAEKVVQAAGGRVSPTEIVVPVQEPSPPPLEQWEPGAPVLRVAVGEPAWEWKGKWAQEPLEGSRSERTLRESHAAGDEATLAFKGTGVALVGPMAGDGGRADVWLDGEKSDLRLDAWVPERTHDNDCWHVTGLTRGSHTVRLVTSEDADERSTGRAVRLQAAIVYDTPGSTR